VGEVIADSNVLVSALVYGGKPLQLLEMGLEGEIALVTSGAILDETLGVLATKFSYTAEQLLEAQQRIESACRGVFTPGLKLEVVSDDPDDDKILELAIQFADAVVVTGDKHLLKIGRYEHVEIMTVGEFLTRALG
jgi:putative PIN family toxin of toxin-antitoxin system